MRRPRTHTSSAAASRGASAGCWSCRRCARDSGSAGRRSRRLSLRRAEEQVEVAERIEVAEVGAVRGERLVGSRRSTFVPQSVSLIGWPSSQVNARLKNLLPSRLKNRIASLFHRVDQPHAVDELALADVDGVVEARQILRRHGQIGVEDHQHVARRGGEPGAHGVALALARLPEEPALSVRIGRDPASMAAKVSSVEWPSTKISSVPRAHLGRAREERGDVPASFRAGTMTDTRSARRDGDAGVGRARMKWPAPDANTPEPDEHAVAEGASPARAAAAGPPAMFGRTRKSVRCRRLVTSGTVSQFCLRPARRDPDVVPRSGGLPTGGCRSSSPPACLCGTALQNRASSAWTSHASWSRSDRMMTSNVPSISVRSCASACDELQLRVLAPRALERRARRSPRQRPSRGLNRSQQVAVGAAQLEHALPGSDKETVNVLETSVIGPRRASTGRSSRSRLHPSGRCGVLDTRPRADPTRRLRSCGARHVHGLARANQWPG